MTSSTKSAFDRLRNGAPAEGIPHPFHRPPAALVAFGAGDAVRPGVADMSFRSSVLAQSACVATLAVSSALSPAQSLTVLNGKHVAHHGDAAPGYASGAVFAGNRGAFEHCAVDEAGNVLFRGSVGGGGVTAPNNYGLFFGSSRANLVRLHAAGDPEPTGAIPGATMSYALGPPFTPMPQLTSGGIVMFGTALSNGGVVPGTNSALMSGSPAGPWSLVARSGDVLPGGAAISHWFANVNEVPPVFNDSGFVLLETFLTGGDVVGQTNNMATVTGQPGNLIYAFRTGTVVPTGETVSGLPLGSHLNSSGQVLRQLRYSSTGVVPASPAADRAVWLYTPGVGAVELVREGQPTPYPNTTFNNHPTYQANEWNPEFGASILNASGKALMHANIAGPGSTGLGDSALFLLSTAGVTPVLRRGDPIPNLPGVTVDYFHWRSLALNNNDWVVALVKLSGAGVTTANDTAILAGPSSGPLNAVVREGDAAPGTGGGTFFDLFDLLRLRFNNANQFVFRAPTSGGFAPTPASLFAWDPVAGVLPVSITAEQHEVQPGVFKTAAHQLGADLYGNEFTNGDGRVLSFSDSGYIVFRQYYPASPSSWSVVVCRIPSLTGSTAGISVATGGTQHFSIAAGAQYGGLVYYVVGGASGTAPGFQYGSFAVPLNYDLYTSYSLSLANTAPFTNTLGLLDGTGHASAGVTLPPGFGILTGVTIHHACLVLDLSLNALHVSEPVALTFLP
jgi:hypothetical protein